MEQGNGYERGLLASESDRYARFVQLHASYRARWLVRSRAAAKPLSSFSLSASICLTARPPPSLNPLSRYGSAADKTWAEAGSGFQSLRPSWLGGLRIGLGICMDINPREFEAPWGAFEFATFHKQRQCDLILFSSAWCNRHPDDEQEGPVDGPDTMKYWASRLRPLVGSSTFFLAANRVGKERAELLRAGCRGDVTFVGSSCALSLREPTVLAALDTTQQALLVITITLPALSAAAANR